MTPVVKEREDGGGEPECSDPGEYGTDTGLFISINGAGDREPLEVYDGRTRVVAGGL